MLTAPRHESLGTNTHAHTHPGASPPLQGTLATSEDMVGVTWGGGGANVGAGSFSVGGRPRHQREVGEGFNSIPGPTHPMPGAFPVLTTTDVPRHRPVSLGAGLAQVRPPDPVTCPHSVSPRRRVARHGNPLQKAVFCR